MVEGSGIVDPAAIGVVLSAVASGAGGALGSQIWDGVSALVQRPFHRDRAVEHDADVVSGGEAELAELARAPGDRRRALALATALVARARVDVGFAEAFQSWWEQAQRVENSGNVTNTVSGGSQYGPVLQGRDFSGLTFGDSSPARQLYRHGGAPEDDNVS